MKKQLQTKQSEPKIGDVRINKKFAWFPRKVISIDNGKWYWIWLENYYQRQVYSKGYGAYGTDRFYWYKSRTYIFKKK